MNRLGRAKFIECLYCEHNQQPQDSYCREMKCKHDVPMVVFDDTTNKIITWIDN